MKTGDIQRKSIHLQNTRDYKCQLIQAYKLKAVKYNNLGIQNSIQERQVQALTKYKIKSTQKG